MTLISIRSRPLRVLIVVSLLIVVLLTVTSANPKLRHLVRAKYNPSVSENGPWRTVDDSDEPPNYLALRQCEAALPQHNLSLPFPERKGIEQLLQRGISVCSNIETGVLMNPSLMNAHLAYISERAYVFQDYTWAPEHFQWAKEKWVTANPRTPLTAIISGPVAGGPFESGDPSPRAISEDWFNIVCPSHERRYINTRDVKPAVAEAPGIDVLTHWQTVLRDTPEHCVEIVGAEEDTFSQTFDLGLWASPRILTVWDSFPQSPISHLLDASPIVHSAVDRNSYLFIPRGPRPPHPAPRNPFHRMLALHLRRGDYEGHCRGMTYINLGFYSWNLFPHLPDRFVSEPDAPGKDERFLERCWPDHAGIVKKAAEARRDYLAHAATFNGTKNNATLDVIYEALQRDGWTVATTRDLVLDHLALASTEQRDVSMAVDMEIARRAAVFLGNGWSSMTSNIVYQRLIDKRDPITVRFT
ncbi:hypothetical protein B0H13DRAFT_1970214 [Mycena leptocephala]|nr:hypothetical protein B0H13DRAFT_1970214 [Mycena leptocephala]